MSLADPVSVVRTGRFHDRNKWLKITTDLVAAGYLFFVAWAFILQDPSPPPAFLPLPLWAFYAGSLFVFSALTTLLTRRLPALNKTEIAGHRAYGARERLTGFVISIALSVGLVIWGTYEIWLGLTSDPAEYALALVLIFAPTSYLLARTMLVPLRRRLPSAVWLTDDHVIGDNEMGRGWIPRSQIQGILADHPTILIVLGPVTRRQPPKGLRFGSETPDDMILVQTENMGVTPPQLETWLRRELNLTEDEWPLEEADQRYKEVEDGFNDALRVIYRGKEVPQEMKLNLWPKPRRSAFRSKR